MTPALWTAEAQLWLFLGAAPLVGLIYVAIRHGTHHLASTGAICITTIWVGYHLVPWLALPIGTWDSFLLKEEYMVVGLRFSALAILTFGASYVVAKRLLDYTGHRRGAPLRQPLSWKAPLTPRSHQLNTLRPLRSQLGPAEGAVTRPNVVQHFARVRVPPVLLVVLSLSVVALAMFGFGGPSELWASSLPRGFGQFDEKDTWDKLKNIALVASSALAAFCVVLSGIAGASAYNRRRWGGVLLAIATVFIASLPSMASFSRASGAGFILLAGLIWVVASIRAALIVGALLFAGALMSWTGYTGRGAYNPGVANFFAALWTGAYAPLETFAAGSGKIDGGINPLNALDAWTAAAWVREFHVYHFEEALLRLIGALQPIPSQFVSWEASVGIDLSWVFGTWGHTGLTTPALGELYFLFEEWGIVALVPLGIVMAWVQKQAEEGNGWYWLLPYAGACLGALVALHSGIRAATRPLLYGLVCVAMLALMKKLVGNGEERASMLQRPRASIVTRRKTRVRAAGAGLRPTGSCRSEA